MTMQALVNDSNHGTFYPTPPALCDKMLEGIDFLLVESILEPSAGKGDLAQKVFEHWRRDNFRKVGRDAPIGKCNMDCIEIDPDLRHILRGRGLRVVHDDFLTYDTYKRYSLVVMNPPFDRGADHLMKAIELQERHGGGIVCLLNAETLRNPHSYKRQRLARLLEEHGAAITFLEGAFLQAERRTDVEIALVKLTIPAVEKESVILSGLRAWEGRRQEQPEVTDTLARTNYIDAILERFQLEAEAGTRMIEEYQALRPYIMRSVTTQHSLPILELHIGTQSQEEDATVNGYLELLRKRYWEALFEHPEFCKKVTTNVLTDLRAQVEELRHFDFTHYNILTIQQQMNERLIQGVEQTILALFEDWTYKYHYGDGTKNRQYFDGWRTNEAYKVGKRVIFPLWAWSQWNGYYPNSYDVVQRIADIEKTFDYLEGTVAERTDIEAIFKAARENSESRKIPLKYFTVTFYKKGTCHVEFTNLDVLHKFNLFGCQRKGWLPPAYGKRRYQDMDAAEQAVVDSFEGQESYRRVMERADYFLVEPRLLELEMGGASGAPGEA